jgi:uncharacterized protein
MRYSSKMILAIGLLVSLLSGSVMAEDIAQVSGTSVVSDSKPSFNCLTAKTVTEKLICSHGELAVGDQKVSRAYEDAISRNPSQKDNLSWSQREWLHYRDNSCVSDQVSKTIQIKCVKESYENRALALSPWEMRSIDNWLISQALFYMMDDPQTAEKIFKSYPNNLQAKVGLAMSLRLFHPLPESKILDDVAHAEPKDGRAPVDLPEYDGSVAGLSNYMAAVSNQTKFSCKLFQKYPELLSALGAKFGSSMDAFLPETDCEQTAHPALPPSVAELTKAVNAYDGGAFDRCTGTMRSGFGRDFWLGRLKREFFPRTFVEERQHAYQSQYADKLPGQNEFPLHDWGYGGLWNWHAYLHVKDLFLKAQADLRDYYFHGNFGFKYYSEAWPVAHDALWADILWARGGRRDSQLDPLREAILDNKDVSIIQGLVSKEEKPITDTSVGEDSLLLISVERPEVEKILLDNGMDVNQINPLGKNALMTAAQYNNLASVQLLLKAGANVNTQTYAPDHIPDNGMKGMYGGECGFYEINYGSRTALMYSAANASLSVIQALLDKGADKSMKDSKGNTAFDYMMGNGPVAANPNLKGEDLETAKKLLALSAEDEKIQVSTTSVISNTSLPTTSNN